MPTDDDEGFVKRLVTHTYTGPSGAVVVVTNVPAEIYVAPDGTEQTNYGMDVAEHLAEMIQVAMAHSRSLKAYSFIVRPEADAP
jgi:hypothetical protein